MLSQCPKFEGAPSEFTTEGTERHHVLAEYFRGNENILANYTEDYLENLEWAIDYIKVKAPMQDHPLEIEQLREAVLPNGLKIKGTPDFVCGSEIIDLKWRFRDYWAQMAAYAWMVLDLDRFPVVTSHLLFANNQAARTYTWTKESAWEAMQKIITNVQSPWAAPIPCEYCGWCANKLKCEALIQQVNIALANNPEWQLPQWHPSEMTTSEELGLALKIARTLADWCESVEFHCREKATKEGVCPSGYTLLRRKGSRFIEDVSGAFHASNLPQDEFIKACSVKPRSLFDIYAKFHGMKKAPAERDMTERLGPIIQNKKDVIMLVVDKPKKQKGK